MNKLENSRAEIKQNTKSIGQIEVGKKVISYLLNEIEERLVDYKLIENFTTQCLSATCEKLQPLYVTDEFVFERDSFDRYEYNEEIKSIDSFVGGESELANRLNYMITILEKQNNYLRNINSKIINVNYILNRML